MMLLLSVLTGIDLEQTQWETLLNSNAVYDIEPVKDGAWLATNGGVLFFSLKDSSFTKHYTNIDGLPSNKCLDIQVLPSTEVWVATTKGLAQIDPRKEKVSPYLLSTPTQPSISSMALNGDTLACGTSNQVFAIVMKHSPNNFEDDYLFVMVNKPADLISWDAASLWGGAENSLFNYNPVSGKLTEYAKKDGLASLNIKDIEITDSVNILTQEGVYRYQKSTHNFKQILSLTDSYLVLTDLAFVSDTAFITSRSSAGPYRRLIRYVESTDALDTLGFWINAPSYISPRWARNLGNIHFDSWGRRWIGCYGENAGDGFILWQADKGRYKNFTADGLNSNYVWHVLLDSRGGVWASHWLIGGEYGVSFYCNGSYSEHFFYMPDSIPFDVSTKVSAVDSKGRVVFASWGQNRGVSRYDPSKKEPLNTDSWSGFSWGKGAVNNTVAWMGVDSYDRIWVYPLTAGQLIVLSPEMKELTRIPWPYGHVMRFEFDSTHVWMATEGGLINYTSSDFAKDPGGGELKLVAKTSYRITDIVLDGSGGVWGTTSAGVFHWSEDLGMIWFKAPMFSNGAISVDRDPWGRLFFLTLRDGLVVYDPTSLAYDSTASSWQKITSVNSPLPEDVDYQYLDIDNTGKVAIATLGCGISLITLPPPINPPKVAVSVYPNPSYLSLGLPVRFTPVDNAESVSIYTISGEKLQVIEPDSFISIQGKLQAEFNIHGLAAGIYIAVITFSDRVEKVKFIVLK